MSFKVKDKIALKNGIPNKAQIPIMNHRDDGELRAIKKGDTCKVFDFTTLRELQLKHNFIDCEVAIAEDFFWTAMPFLIDGKLNVDKEDGHDALDSCVVASAWGTPCVITPDGDAYACYKELPIDEFPGVYLKDWDISFFSKEVDDSVKFVDEKIAELKREYGL